MLWSSLCGEQMRWWVLLAMMVPVVGCTASIENLERQVADLSGRIDVVQRTNASMRQRVESIEDQVLLIEDEVETQRLVGMRRASIGNVEAPRSLPVVKVVPKEAAGQSDYSSATQGTRIEQAESFAVVDDAYQRIDDSGQVVGSSADGKARKPVQADIPLVRVRPKGEDDSGPLDSYRDAYEMYKSGRVEEARRSFEEFVKKNPAHTYADNAQYWVGECLYDRGDFAGALREFMRAVTDHPDGNKVPDAMVKVGLSQAKLNRPEEARRMYDAVMLTYPESEAAAVAMRLLGEMP